MKNNKIVQGAALALVMGTAGNAFASMGNIGTTYGVLPTDVASAQALSMFNTKVSSVYYNPAYLAKDPRGELTMGILHADHELRLNSTNTDGVIWQGGVFFFSEDPDSR